MTGITEQGNLDTKTQTQGEHHVTMETDKGYQGLPATIRRWERLGADGTPEPD